MATSLDKLEYKVQINYWHVKLFHMVKKMRKLVQDIRRYSTKYAEPRREHTTQFRLEYSTGPIFTKTKPCFHLANVQRMHVVSFCLHYGYIIWLPWQTSLDKLENMV